MKKNYIVKQCLAFTVLISVLASCTSKTKKEHHDVGKLDIDSGLKALVQPTDEQVVAKATVIKASYESKILMAEVPGMVNYDSRNETSVASRVGGRLEKLNIKYNYQPVKKGQLLMEIYAPDLAAAQQELIYLSQSNNDQHLLAMAKQRLLLLGMTAQSIQQVLRTKKVDYRIGVYSPADGYILEKAQANNAAAASAAPMPAGNSGGGGGGMAGMDAAAPASSGEAPMPQLANSNLILREGQYVNAGQALFTIYKANQLLAEFALKPNLALYVKKGSELAFYKTADKEGTFRTARVGLIQPLIKAGENFTLARVYINRGSFKAGELLTAKFPLLISQSFWLPKSALVSLGTKSTVFKKENGVFVPKTIQIGLILDGMVQVNEDIRDWEVAKDAAFLIDSESFIQTK